MCAGDADERVEVGTLKRTLLISICLLALCSCVYIESLMDSIGKTGEKRKTYVISGQVRDKSGMPLAGIPIEVRDAIDP